jgi:tetratricopeptide (TPR) repeat protein
MSLFIKDRLLLSLAATVVIVAITGCSAEKKPITSWYILIHTSKYNILFNGEQSYLNGIERIEQNFTDDYSGVLPVFVYGTEQETSVANSYMDRAVEKASKVITLHSVTAKPAIRGDGMTEKQREFYAMKEYNRYVDDAYLLMGSAYFYKHEYTLAERVFLQVQNDFKGSPEAYESQVWLARIYNETGRLRFANEIFDQLENNAAFPEKQLGFLYASMADYHLKQNNYPRALDYVSRALETRNSKKTRTRYLFILAQLYEKTATITILRPTYGKVISMNPPFKWLFTHASIRLSPIARGTVIMQK